MTSPVLMALAERFRKSEAGRAGAAARDFIIDHKQLLQATGATDGDALVEAEKHLRVAERESGGLISLDLHPRDERLIHRVRVKRDGGEAWLFERVGLVSPSAHRQHLARLFEEAMDLEVSDRWRAAWLQWLSQCRVNALEGGALRPLQRDDLTLNEELLRVIARLLRWSGESLIRFASCILCGESKRLEHLQGRVEDALQQITSGEIASLEALGIVEAPRQVLLHGPLRLKLASGDIDLGLLRHGLWISGHDLENAINVETTATRCLSIENETSFHELAKLHAGVLLVQTSFPNRAALALYQRLPAELPCWHFGDTDPAGYDILRDLRERTQRIIMPLHMQWRDDATSAPLADAEQQIITRLLANPLMKDVHAELEAMRKAARKGLYEQEHLGWPKSEWPFYASVSS